MRLRFFSLSLSLGTDVIGANGVDDVEAAMQPVRSTASIFLSELSSCERVTENALESSFLTSDVASVSFQESDSVSEQVRHSSDGVRVTL